MKSIYANKYILPIPTTTTVETTSTTTTTSRGRVATGRIVITHARPAAKGSYPYSEHNKPLDFPAHHPVGLYGNSSSSHHRRWRYHRTSGIRFYAKVASFTYYIIYTIEREREREREIEWVSVYIMRVRTLAVFMVVNKTEGK